MTNEVFQTPKIGDRFKDADGQEFVIANLFEVQGDNWLEYQSQIKQPFFLKVEAFLERFRPINS